MFAHNFVHHFCSCKMAAVLARWWLMIARMMKCVLICRGNYDAECEIKISGATISHHFANIFTRFSKKQPPSCKNSRHFAKNIRHLPKNSRHLVRNSRHLAKGSRHLARASSGSTALFPIHFLTSCRSADNDDGKGEFHFIYHSLLWFVPSSNTLSA